MVTARRFRELALFVVASALVASVHPAAAQEMLTANTLRQVEGGAPPAATIEEVSWIAGHWQGSGLGGISEEVWAPPFGGTMIGAFKMLREGSVAFYEIIVIQPQGESLTLKLKHFHPDLQGWEERDEVVEFPLVRVENMAAYFAGMTFRRPSPDELRVFVALGSGGADPREAEFVYFRVGSEAHRSWQRETAR